MGKYFHDILRAGSQCFKNWLLSWPKNVLPQLMMISHSLLNRKKMYLGAFLKLKAEFCSNQPSKEFYKIHASQSIVLQSDPGGKLVLQHPTQGLGVSVLSLLEECMGDQPSEHVPSCSLLSWINTNIFIGKEVKCSDCSILLLAFVNKHKHIHWERAEVLGESCLISENSMSMSIQNAWNFT